VSNLGGEPHVRFDERGVETEHATASEAPATERVGNGWAAATSPRHTSTLHAEFGQVASQAPFGRRFQATRSSRTGTGAPDRSKSLNWRSCFIQKSVVSVRKQVKSILFIVLYRTIVNPYEAP
jgi:hypothetical protein